MRKIAGKIQSKEIDFEYKFKELPINDIDLSESFMRKMVFNEEFEELKKSIKDVGLINPITVLREGKRFKLVAGLRRYHACRLLEHREIECKIVDVMTKDFVKIQYQENMLRENVDVIEEGIFLNKVKDKINANNKEIADMLGKSESYVQKRILITEIDELLIKALREKRISINAALLMSKCKEKEKLIYLIDYFDEKKLRDVDLKVFVEQIIGEKNYNFEGRNINNEGSQVYNELYQEPKGICDICGKIVPLAEIKVVKVCLDCENQESESEVEVL